MPLTLITGAAHTGKSGLLYEQLRADTAACQPTLLLPQLPDVRRVNREFADKGIQGVRVAVFDNWVRAMWALHGDGRQLVTAIARRGLVARAVAHAPSRAINKASRTPGFIKVMTEVCASLSDSATPISNDAVTAELAGMVTAYRQHLAQAGLVELETAAAVLAASPPAMRGPIAVNNFSDLSAIQELLLTRMALQVDVRIALSWEDGCPATEALTPLVNRLERLADARITTAGHPERERALVALSAALFTGRNEDPPNDAVRLGLASGPEAECALVAREVRRAIDEGFDPGKIAVAFRAIGDRGSTLGTALRAERVPHIIDISVPFRRTRFGAAVLSVLRAVGPRGDREDMVAFLMSPFSGADADAVADLDAMWRAKRVDDSRLTAIVGKALPEVAIMLSAAQRLVRGSSDSSRNWQILTNQMIVAAHADDSAGLSGALDLAAHRALLQAVGELIELDATVNADKILEAVGDAGVSTTTEDQGDAVLVTEAHRLRGRCFEVVVLGGLSGAEFEPSDATSLSRTISETLGGPPRTDPALVERMLFHTVLTRPARRLVLIRQSVDERGEATRPSVFWDAVLDVYRQPEQAGEGVIPNTIAVEWLVGRDGWSVPSRPSDESPAQREGRRSVAPRRGALGVDVVKHLQEREEFSASEVEAYLTCPYRWFIDRALATEDLDSVFDARERGSRAHRLLGAFYTEWCDAGRGRVTLPLLDQIFQQLASVSARLTGSMAPVRTIAEELSAAKAEKWVRDVIRDDIEFLPGFQPMHHELRFGQKDGRPLRLWGIGLKGAIDRVDVGRGGLFIIDYKSSAVCSHMSFVKKGLVQLPVYAAAASTILDAPVHGAVYRSLAQRTCRGFWDRGLANPGALATSRDAVDADALQDIFDTTGRMVRTAVEGMRKGLIPCSPRDKEACRTCGAAIFCGAQR